MHLENIDEALHYAQIIENLGSKAILFILMCFLSFVSFHLLKQLLNSIKEEKEVFISNKRLEDNIERIATSTETSLRHLQEVIKEHKETNLYVKEVLEQNLRNLEQRFNELEFKVIENKLTKGE